MSFYPHTRNLGSQSGIQLNPIKDNTNGFVTDASDQTVSFIGRFKRGRIDVPFKVNRGNLKSKLGASEALRVSALNETYVHVYEAVNNGGREAVISRLSPAAATNSFAVFTIAPDTKTSAFTVSPTVPANGFAFYLKDLECFNDGVVMQVTAPRVLDATGTEIATKVVTIRVFEPDGSTLRYEVTGSLDNTAVDEYGQDYSLQSQVEIYAPNLQIVTAQNVSIDPTTDCYGRNADGSEKAVTTSAPLILFNEGGTAYASDDYDRVIAALENSTFDYGYASTGGSQAVGLISKMAIMNIRANRNMAVDVPGDLTPEAAEVWVRQLGINSEYVSFYWAPLRTNDPLNGGRAVIGVSGYQLGLRCGRNAQTNAYGLAPKNYPIAGSDWMLNRTGVEQLVVPDEFELSDLADAKINPVIFESYNNGSGFVFFDSLTSKQTNGYLKLISVAEMATSLDDMIVKAAKMYLQLPMDVAISKMEKFLKALLDGARATGWLVASDDPNLGDKGYAFTVARNAQRPADRMDVQRWSHYDGVARAVYVSQTISN